MPRLVAWREEELSSAVLSTSITSPRAQRKRLKQFVDRSILPTPRGMLNQRGYRSTGFLARVRKQKNKISPEPDALKKPAIPFKKNVRPRD